MKILPRTARSALALFLLASVALPSAASVLVQDSFPTGTSAYPATVTKLNQPATNYSGSGIQGLISGWATGSSNTGVFWYSPEGLSFPEGILRTPAGSGSAFFQHPQASATASDCGRILGRRIDSSIRSTLTSGVYYMSVLVKTADPVSLSLLSPNHWRMMGIAPSCEPNTSGDLMNNGVYLGVANLNNAPVNALRVGPAMITISPHEAGQTYFLLARIDLINLTVHAREITAADAASLTADSLDDYPVSLPLPPANSGTILSFMNLGGDYALANTNTYFDELLVSTSFAEQLGYAPNTYALGDTQITSITDTSFSGSVNLLAAATGGSLIVDVRSVTSGDIVQSVTLDNPVLGENAFTLYNLNSGNQFTVTARIEVNDTIVATGTPILFRTSGTTVLEDEILVRDGFPTTETAYKASNNLYKYSARIIDPSVEGLNTGWAYGDTGTGVLHVDASTGLAFPSAIPRDPTGDGSLYFTHGQATATPADYGRLLGCGTVGPVSQKDAAGIYYMSLLTQTPSENALTRLSEGHWRMMGLGQSSAAGSTSSLMSSGIFLGIARIDDVVVNALRVGNQLAAISPYTAGTTSFLLARIDFNTRKIYAREVTAPGAADTPENYTAVLDFPSSYTSAPFQYFIIGGDYAIAGNRTYFDEFLLSTRLTHHIGVEPGSFTITDVLASSISTNSATVSVQVASLGSSDGTLCLDVIDEAASTTNTFSAAPSVGVNEFALTDLTPASSYLLRAYFLVDGEPAGDDFSSAFGTFGVPVLENLSAASVTPTNSPLSVLRLSVDLTAPGITPTTVEFLLGTSPELLEPIGASDPATAPGPFSVDSSAYPIGTTVYFAARATCEYEGRTLVDTTPTKSYFFTGDEIWLNTTDNNDWNTPANWSQGIVPTPGIPATIKPVGGSLFSTLNIAASNLLVECGSTPVDLNLNDKTLTTTRLTVGSGARGLFTLQNGYTTVNELRIGGTSKSRNSRLTIDGGRIETLSLTRIGNPEGTHDGNTLFVTNGASAALSTVRIGLSDTVNPIGNHIVLGPGVNMSYTDLALYPGGNNTITANNATIWSKGNLTITPRSGSNSRGTNTVTLANNSVMSGNNTAINFEWYNGRLNILDGSFLDAYNVRLGWKNDQGSGNEVVVSNSIFKAYGIYIPDDDRFHSNVMRVYNDPGVGSNTVVYATNKIGVGCDTARANHPGNCNNLLLVRNATINTSGTLFVGGGSPDDTGNTLDIAGEHSTLSARWFSMRNAGVLKFAIPKNGFLASPLITVTDAANISTDAHLIVDTTEARSGSYTLLEAPTFVGTIDPKNMTFIKSNGQNVKVHLNEENNGKLVIEVEPTATILLFR